jgi:hypothetical protein
MTVHPELCGGQTSTSFEPSQRYAGTGSNNGCNAICITLPSWFNARASG